MNEFFVGVKTLVLHNRKTLLLRHAEAYDPKQAWEYPGGAMIFGETIYETLRREVCEETGLEIEIDRLLLAMTAMVGERQCVGLTYLSRASTDKVTLSEEHTGYIWADKEQLINMLSKSMLDNLRENHVLETLDIE